MNERSISFYYKDGASDKVYHIQIEELACGLYDVKFQYGRRGGSLTSKTKNDKPVPLSEAVTIYDKMVKVQMSKGYTEGQDGTPYAGTELAGQLSGLIPWLPNIITLERAQQLLNDPNWFMQEKMDGRHMMTRVTSDSVVASNRKGIVIATTQPIVEGLLQLRNKPLELDGEDMGDSYVTYDLLTHKGEDIRNLGAGFRFDRLFSIVADSGTCINVVTTEFTTSGKTNLFNKIKKERGEGVIFKNVLASYIAGRPNSGGNILKFKFKAMATVRVNSINPNARSVGIDVRYGNVVRNVGNVTILPNFPVPEPGSYIEVEYLYFYEGGSLFQPVYKGPRLDKDQSDTYQSLKVKQESDNETN